MAIKSIKFVLWEAGGAFADLGTLLPLAVALIMVNHVSSVAVFLVVGLTYITTGVFYRIPVPVQPLKAMSAIAIALGLSAGVLSAAGLVMAGLLLLLAATGAVGAVARLFPKPVVRGIQFSVAALLIKAGAALVNRPQVLIGDTASAVSLGGIPTGWLLAAGSVILLVVFLRARWLPATVAVLTFGVLASLSLGSLDRLDYLRIGFSFPVPGLPAPSDLSTALFVLVIPQIPLTLGNAVFASADAAHLYFGARSGRVTHKNLLTTMGMANLAAGLMGGMPVCHGSGGMTAHYKLGARTGMASFIIGSTFVVLALFFAGNAMPLLSFIPYPVLGVMVAFVGLQHALLARDLEGWLDIGVVILITVIALATDNLALGFAAGLVLLHGPKALAMFRRAAGARRAGKSLDT